MKTVLPWSQFQGSSPTTANKVGLIALPCTGAAPALARVEGVRDGSPTLRTTGPVLSLLPALIGGGRGVFLPLPGCHKTD